MKEKLLKRKKELIGIGVVLIVGIIIVGLFLPKKADIVDLYNKLKDQPEVSSRMKNEVYYDTEDEDIIPNVRFLDESNKDYEVMILLCESEGEAEVFQYYYDEISRQEKEIRDKQEHGDYFRDVDKLNGWISYVYRVENCVMHIPIELGDEVASLYKKAFETTIKSLNFNKQDFDKDITEAKNAIQSSIDKNVAEYKDAIDKSINTFKTTGDNEMKTLKVLKDETSLNKFKEKYLSIDAPIFKEKIESWTKDVKDIEEQIKIEKKKAEEEKKKAEERIKNTHSAGTYKVGTDISAGEYYISGNGYFSVSKNGSGDLSSIIVNGNFKNNTIITVAKGQYLTVQRATFMPMKYAPQPDLTKEGMFKVGTHLPAGEYKLKATSSAYSGYYAVYSSSKQGISHIVKNNNFDGTAYVTVKKGQYLELNRCSIDK